MGKIYLTIVLLIVVTVTANAASWVVATAGGNYTTIQAAVTNAATGDTIYILNTAVGNGYQGTTRFKESANVAISSKNLTFLPYYTDTLFFCQTQWTITPSTTAASEIDFIGMNDSAGGAVAATAAIITVAGPGFSAAARASIKILGCQLGTSNSTTTANTSAYIVASQNFLDLTVYGAKIYNGTNNATIALRHGSIIGDSIAFQSDGGASAGIAVSAEGTATTDTCMILGNIISDVDAAGSNGNSCIYWNSNTMFFDIRNNLLLAADYGLYVNETIASAGANDKIYNNTISCSNAATSYTTYGLYVTATSPNNVEIQNNCIARTVSGGTLSYAIYNNSNGYVGIYNNYIDANFSTKIANTPVINVANNSSIATIGSYLGTSTITQPPTSGGTTAASSLGYYTTSGTVSGLINGGSSALRMNNVDGTQNTIGCYGGSFTLTNFFPLNTGSARIWMTTTYGALLQGSGNTLTIKGTSYDR